MNSMSPAKLKVNEGGRVRRVVKAAPAAEPRDGRSHLAGVKAARPHTPKRRSRKRAAKLGFSALMSRAEKQVVNDLVAKSWPAVERAIQKKLARIERALKRGLNRRS